MKRFPLYLMASALALSSASLFAEADSPLLNDSAKPVKSGMTTTGDDLQRMGSKLADEATTRDIQASLSKTVNDALSEKKFDDMVKHFAKADRDRIGDLKNQRHEDLDRAISQFRTEFKNKYRQDFDLKAEHLKGAMVYSGADKKTVTISLSETAFNGHLKDRGLKSDIDVKGGTVKTDTKIDTTRTTVTGVVPAETGNPASDPSSTGLGNRTSIDSQGDNSNTVVRGSEAPRATVATDTTVTGKTTVIDTTNTGISGAGNTGIAGSRLGVGQQVSLTLVDEGMNWKINIPDQITADQLRGNLIKHIQMLNDQKATWPADVNGGYHSAAFHVLQALNDSSLATDR